MTVLVLQMWTWWVNYWCQAATLTRLMRCEHTMYNTQHDELKPQAIQCMYINSTWGLSPLLLMLLPLPHCLRCVLLCVRLHSVPVRTKR